MINGRVKDVRVRMWCLFSIVYFSSEECITPYKEVKITQVQFAILKKEVMRGPVTLFVIPRYITCYAPLHYLLCIITLLVMRHKI